MNSALIGFAVLLQLLSSAAAPAWRIVAYGSDGSQLSADLTRSSCKSGICSSTELTEYLQPRPSGASKVVDDVQYDCAMLTTRTLSETSFDVRSRRISHLGTPTAWTPVAPGSVGFESMAFACAPRQAAAGPAPVNAGALVTSTPAPAGVPAPPVGRQEAAVAQIASSPTENGARSALIALAKARSEPFGVSDRVQKAVVHGRVTYRALVTGFASQAAAAAFCRQLRGEGGCLVRADRTKD